MKKVIPFVLCHFLFLITFSLSAKDTPMIRVFNGTQDSVKYCTGYFSTPYCTSLSMIVYSAIGAPGDSTDWYVNEQMIARTYGGDTFHATEPGIYTAKIYLFLNYSEGPGWPCDPYNDLNKVSLSFKAPCPVPSTGFFTSNISSTEATINWDALSCGVGYKAEYRIHGANTWVKKNISSNTGSKKLKDLFPNTTYDWKVKTKCSAAPNLYSDFSAKQTFTTLHSLEKELSLAQSVSIQVFPNPAIEFIEVHNNSTGENGEMVITNSIGRMMVAKSVSPEDISLQFDVSSWSPGIYCVNFSDGKCISTCRFVKL